MEQFQVNIYPVKDGTFLTSFAHPLSKKKIRKGFASREEAKLHKEAMEKRYARKKGEHYRELNIEELVMIFNQEKPGNVFTRAKSHIISFVETFGELRIEQISPLAFKEWLDQIQKEYRLREISMRGLKCEIDTLFAFLVDKEIISESPLRTIFYKKYTPSLNSRNILTEKQMEEIQSAAKYYSPGYLYPIIKLFAETAAKNKEVVELTWQDVDLEKGTVRFKKGEKSQERTLKISTELVALLKAKPKKSGSLFWTYYNEPFTTNKLHRAICEFKEKKLCHSEWTLLDFRHSFAVNFLSKGGDIKELQRILGQGYLYETKKLYGDAAKVIV